jgi:AcrR family transcriptional regulator
MSRLEILQAAAAIFQEKGYHAASMQDIAEAVDLQKGSLYHHVSGKQEILLALLDSALEMIIDRLTVVAESPAAPEEKFRAGVRTYLGFLTEYRALSSVLLLEHRSLDSKLQKKHIPHRDQVEELWLCILEEGIEAGIFHPEETDLIVRALLGVLNWTITWYHPDGRLSSEEIADLFSDLFLAGLKSPA